jgi:hypothetical protein
MVTTNRNKGPDHFDPGLDATWVFVDHSLSPRRGRGVAEFFPKDTTPGSR